MATFRRRRTAAAAFWLQDGGSARRPGARTGPGADARWSLPTWMARQTGAFITDPWIDFAVNGRNYRLVVQSVTIDRGENNGGPVVLNSLEGQLFSDAAR